MIKDVGQFLSEVRSEIAKIQWPGFEEFVGSTIIVLILVVAFSLYLGAVDLLISRIAEYIFTMYGMS
jgi:preprotein translocase subunit SecE